MVPSKSLLYWSMLRTLRAGQQLQAALHLADGVAQRVGRQLGLGDDGREEMRNALVHAQFHALGIDQDQPHLLGRGADTAGT